MAQNPDPGDRPSKGVERGIADSPATLMPIAERDVIQEGETIATPPGGLRARAARGLLVNTAFRVGLAGLALILNVAIAGFVSAAVYGLWAIIIATLVAIAFLKQVGIADKYLQQRESDQVTAFQTAFTFEFFYSLAFFAVSAALLPVFAYVVYGEPEILLPGLVVAFSVVIRAFQSPSWIYYRRLDFFRQRVIEAVDPVVTAVATITLLIAGMELWGLAIGFIAGTISGAAVAMVANPYPLAIRYDRQALREYVGFSWPLFVGGISSLLVVQGSLIIGNAALGIAAVGAIGLAGNFSRFSTSVEQLLNTTLYPAVCRVQDRRDTLLEAFVTSNRLGLMWALPFGIGLALFAPDLVEFVLGPTWDEATALMQIFGLTFAFGTIAFAWSVFYKAIGNTRPIAVGSVLSVVVFFAVTVPLMLTVGVIGYGIGMAAAMLTQLAFRGVLMRRLFPGFNLITHALRALAPLLPAIAAVAVIRLVWSGARSPEEAIFELVVFAMLAGAVTFVAERELIREALSYLTGSRRRGGQLPVAAETPAATGS